MDMTFRAATPAEQIYAYKQSKHINEQCGNIGQMWGTPSNSGEVCFSHWESGLSEYNTPEFNVEFKSVLEMLCLDERYGCALKNRDTMVTYCLDHSEARFKDSQEYVFRADTKAYSYLIRCTPNEKDHLVCIYPYTRNRLDRHIKQAEKGIRFVTPKGKTVFRVPDGETIQITTSGAGTRINTARFVDNNHFEVVTKYDSYLYDICEFAEWLKRHEGTVIPLRSTLPDQCYCVLPGSDEIIIVKKGESGYYRTDLYGHDRADAISIVNECNGLGGVTKAQEQAMLAGSIFGWDTCAADPKNYDEQGQPVKPKRHERGDAR